MSYVGGRGTPRPGGGRRPASPGWTRPGGGGGGGVVCRRPAGLGIGPSSSPGEAGRGPPGGIPVSEAGPRRLGVHAAISVPGVPDEVPPEYVPRDVDAAEHGVRAKVAAAAGQGGFVLLVGG